MANQKKFKLRLLIAKKRYEIDLEPRTYILGRGQKADFPLGDLRISSKHAQLDVGLEHVSLTDLGSTNGTFINGEQMTPQVPVILSTDMQIEIGPVEIGLLEEEIEESAHDVQDASPEKPNGKNGAQPPPPPPVSPNGQGDAFGLPDDILPLLGLSIRSQRLLGYLPEIYHPDQPMAEYPNDVHLDDSNDFMARFLGIFESILFPLEWTVDNFDLFLHPSTAPSEFLPWLARWHALQFEETWSETKRRILIREAYDLFSMRGTKWALQRILEIYTGVTPVIDDLGDHLERHLFTVTFPLSQSDLEEGPDGKRVDLGIVQRLIEEHKPVHTTYQLKLKKG